MDKENVNQLRKLIIITAAVIAVIVIGFVTFQRIVNSKRGTVVIDSVPSDLVLTANGKRISSTSTQTFTPGTYKLEAKRAGFADLTKDITVEKGKKQDVFMYMNPNNDEGYQWLRDHPQEAIKREGAVGAEHKETVKKAVEKNDFITQLPIIGPGFLFRIDYGAAEADNKFPDQPTIFITGANQDNQQLGIRWMVSHGYDPEKMNIVFVTKDPETE